MDPIPSPAAAAFLEASPYRARASRLPQRPLASRLPQRPLPEGEAGGYQQMQLAALLHALRPDAPMART